jgi:hypothetical protein
MEFDDFSEFPFISGKIAVRLFRFIQSEYFWGIRNYEVGYKVKEFFRGLNQDHCPPNFRQDDFLCWRRFMKRD